MKVSHNKQTQPHLLTYAEKIRKAAEFKGITLPQIAKHLGVDVAAVYHWVAGVNGVSHEYRPVLAKLLGLSINDLVAPPNPNPRAPSGLKSKLGRPHNAAPNGHDAAHPAPDTDTDTDTGPAQRALVAYQDKAASIPYTPPVSDLCAFKLRSDGTVTVKLETTLPYAKGLRLMGYLFEFGLVPEQDKGEHP